MKVQLLRFDSNRHRCRDTGDCGESRYHRGFLRHLFDVVRRLLDAQLKVRPDLFYFVGDIEAEQLEDFQQHQLRRPHQADQYADHALHGS
jgi:hypothetical protein